jgi:hypothetical protein
MKYIGYRRYFLMVDHAGDHIFNESRHILIIQNG